jgi:hypothetical protein
MVGVAQLVRVPDCDSGCRRFESDHSPFKKRSAYVGLFLCIKNEFMKFTILHYGGLSSLVLSSLLRSFAIRNGMRFTGV